MWRAALIVFSALRALWRSTENLLLFGMARQMVGPFRWRKCCVTTFEPVIGGRTLLRVNAHSRVACISDPGLRRWVLPRTSLLPMPPSVL